VALWVGGGIGVADRERSSLYPSSVKPRAARSPGSRSFRAPPTPPAAGGAFSRAAAIEGSGSSGWLRLEIILDSHTYRYLGARHVVTRDHFIPNTWSASKGSGFHKGQVLVSRAQLALAVVDAPVSGPARPPPVPPMSKRPG
jgi:hypothetical protein